MTLPPSRPLIYLISDGCLTNENYEQRSAGFLELIRAAVQFRIPLVQIREKRLSGRNLFDLASRALKLSRGSGTRLLINDRLDIALASWADGVHLTSTSFTADAVRQVAPDGFTIGVSIHTTDEAEKAKTSDADFVVFGPIFETPGKGSATGLDELKDVVLIADSFPVIAIGGINETNYCDVLKSGAAGFAAIRFLNNAANLEMLSKEFRL